MLTVILKAGENRNMTRNKYRDIEKVQLLKRALYRFVTILQVHAKSERENCKNVC